VPLDLKAYIRCCFSEWGAWQCLPSWAPGGVVTQSGLSREFRLQARARKDHPTLRARITELVQEVTGALSMSSSLRLDGQLDSHIPVDIGEDLLHALREALSNAARHGSATQVEVTVEAGSNLALLVRDNGTGIKDTSRRSGLANLARRAERHGGALTIGPGGGGGTELQWRVPLTPSAP